VTRALAVDIGGTKLAAAVIDDDGTVHERHQAPTVRGTDAGALFDALRDVIDAVTDARPSGSGIEVCGVGCGGPMTLDGEMVSPLNIPAWRDFPLRSRLAEALGVPVFVDNDAKALALGEGWIGAAAGAANFMAMVVSTGVGGGIVLDGRLLDGAAGNAGHVGHVVVEPDGPPCTCGGRGCLEAVASGTAIERLTGQPPASAPRDVVERVGRAVGVAVASVVHLLDLPLVVIAGSVALGYGDPFFAAAQHALDEHAGLDFARGARIRPAGLGDAGPLVGAAAVGLRGFGVL
jgi:glucokinase